MNQTAQAYRNAVPNTISASQAEGMLDKQQILVKDAASLVDQLRVLERLIFGSRPEKEGGDSVAPMPDGFFPRLEGATTSLGSLLSNAHAITNELLTRFQGQSTSGISVR